MSNLNNKLGLEAKRAFDEIPDIKKNSKDAFSQSAAANQKANEAKSESESAKGIATQTRNELNNIIREQTQNGDLAPEVTQARGTHQTVGERLDRSDEQLAQMAHVLFGPRWFGAKGDGETNDIDAFRQAVDEAPVGGVIYVPPSDKPYIWNPTTSHNGENTCLFIDKRVTFISDGAEVKLPNFFDNKSIRRMLKIDSNDVIVKGIKFNPNTDNQYKIDGQGHKWWWAEEGDTDILVHRTDIIDIAAPSKRVLIEGNHFHQGYTSVRFSGYGFFTDVFSLEDEQTILSCIVRDNVFERTRGNAVNQSGSSRQCLVYNNKFINCYYHGYRNYYGNEDNTCRDNFFYRDFEEMGKWYEEFDNRFYRTSNPNHSLFLINRGHIRVGRGNEYSRYIRNNKVLNNTLITRPPKEGTTKIYDENNVMMASILEDSTSGGNIIRGNDIDGGGFLYGVSFRDYFDNSATPSVINRNKIRNVKNGIHLNYTRTSILADINVRNNEFENVENPLHLNTVTTFSRLNMSKKDLVITTPNSPGVGKSDVVIQKGDEVRFIQDMFNALINFDEVVFLEGRFELNNEVVLRRKLDLINRNSEIVCMNLSGDNIPFISIRYEGVDVSRLKIRNESTKSGSIGLELREANISKLLGNDVDGFAINYRVRGSRNTHVNRNISRNSSSRSFDIGTTGGTARQTIFSENIIETATSGKNVHLGTGSDRTLAYGNILNGGEFVDTGTNNAISNNLP